jgi:hypothetical protein
VNPNGEHKSVLDLHPTDLGRQITVVGKEGSCVQGRLTKVEFDEMNYKKEPQVYLFIVGDGWSTGFSPHIDTYAFLADTE